MSFPFDITAACTELRKMEAEQKRINDILKDLKKKKVVLEEKIQKYLIENNHQGVMIHGMTVMAETKTRTKPLNKKEKEERVSNWLKSHDVTINDSGRMMEELSKVTKGNAMTKTSITINYPNSKNNK